jgi:ATP-dependent helicase/DNAse subunit B
MDNIKPKEKKHVSFSQFRQWLTCPNKFYLDYVLGLKQSENSLHTCFGEIIHEVIQLYVKTLYNESLVKAEELELYKLFKVGFENKLKEKNIEATEDDITDFIYDGEDIINAFLETATRIKNFPKDKYELVGIENEINIGVKNNVDFIAYLDLVLKEKSTGNIKIIDFKTSFNGWTTQKDDITKIYQLLLYKAFYSKTFNIPLNKITVEYFILKRRLYEGVNYPQSRIQNYIPPNNSKSVLSAVNDFVEFLDECFTKDGDYITDEKHYPRNPGRSKKHCKYCAHKKIRCNQKETPVC